MLPEAIKHGIGQMRIREKRYPTAVDALCFLGGYGVGLSGAALVFVAASKKPGVVMEFGLSLFIIGLVGITQAQLRYRRFRLVALGRPVGWQWRSASTASGMPRFGWLSMYGPKNIAVHARRLGLPTTMTILAVYLLAILCLLVYIATN